MRWLVYDWASYLQYDLYFILREKGIAFDKFAWTFEDKNADEAFEDWFSKNIDTAGFDALISINYWPVLSKMCKEKGLKYIAWCYDCPLNVERIEETLGNETNYVFLFDLMQYNTYKMMGFDTVYHLPLGTNPARLKNIFQTDIDLLKYQCDVSFVGSLYESQILNIMDPLDAYTKGYLDSLMDIQLKVYGYYLFDDALDEELMERINSRYQQVRPGTKFILSKEALAFAMASEVTRKERAILLQLCGNRFQTDCYSFHDCRFLKNVRKRECVDYLFELPKVYAASKINLNPSLKCIQTGIPLRVFDVLGSGGFLLSNYQAELCEAFENEKEVVIYENLEDALDKADFYLRHEELRVQIANAGREKVFTEHTLQQRLEYITEILEG